MMVFHYERHKSSTLNDRILHLSPPSKTIHMFSDLMPLSAFKKPLHMKVPKPGNEQQSLVSLPHSLWTHPITLIFFLQFCSLSLYSRFCPWQTGVITQIATRGNLPIKHKHFLFKTSGCNRHLLPSVSPLSPTRSATVIQGHKKLFHVIAYSMCTQNVCITLWSTESTLRGDNCVFVFSMMDYCLRDF